jgi:hypothetical protein
VKRIVVWFATASIALLPVLATAISPSSNAQASITTDKTKAHQLEVKIEAEANKVQALVDAADTVDGRLQALRTKIAQDQKRLRRDNAAQGRASNELRNAAVEAYINAASGNSSSIGTFISSANASALPTREAYLGFASGTLDSAVATYQQDKYTTSKVEQALASAQHATLATLTSLDSARQAAQGALNSEEATLSGVNENLLALVNAQDEARAEAREAAAEAELAAQAAQQASSAPATVTITPNAAGTYADPLRGIRGLSAERVDQGVDFNGFGPIFAIGDGVILSVVNGGWPGGTFICYRLTDGPADGLVVYAAEDINPYVQVGQAVTRNTVLGQLYDGPEGIETGWASAAADGVTMAASYGQYWGGNSTAFGANFSQFLSLLGAPGGQIQNSPTGSLPAGWPSW